MIDFEYAAHNIKGVWRMAFTDAEDWRRDIDRSVGGVFRSLWAVALATPFKLLMAALAQRAGAKMNLDDPLLAAPRAMVLTAEMAAYLIDWAASIAALVLIARTLRASDRAADLIVAFNWGQVITVVVATAPFAVFAITGSPHAATLLMLPAFAFAIALIWRIIRKCLPLDIGMAVAVVAILALIGILANGIARSGAFLVLQLLSP